MSARTARLLLWPAGLALGIAAEWVYFGWEEPRDWLPDIAVGWTLIACGLVAWSRRPESRSGILLAATGFAWFAANFSEQALYLHRGPLVHLVLAYPDGRLRGRLDLGVVAVAYAIAVLPAVWSSEAAALVLSAALLAVAGARYLRTVGTERRKRLAGLQATAFVSAVFAGTAAARLVFPTQEGTDATLLAYEIALCMLAAGLLLALVREPWAGTGVTDLVVELGEARSGSLRDALASRWGTGFPPRAPTSTPPAAGSTSPLRAQAAASRRSSSTGSGWRCSSTTRPCLRTMGWSTRSRRRRGSRPRTPASRPRCARGSRS